MRTPYSEPKPAGAIFLDSSLGYSPSASEASHSVIPDISPEDGFINSQWRAGGPVLCDLPGHVGRPLHSDIRCKKNDMIDMSTRKILNQYGIESRSMGIFERRSCLDPGAKPVPTMLVLANGENLKERWREAARRIHQVLRAFYIPDASVEILHQELARRPDCSPVLETDQIFSKWMDISRQILQTIDHDEWTSLGCYRYGRDDDPSKNQPTIVVTVLRNTNPHKRWNNILHQIRDILAENEVFDTRVQIQKDEIGCDRNRCRLDLKLNYLKDHVQPGVGVGIRDNSNTAGTFSGIVELRRSGEMDFEKYGLTSFSCLCNTDSKVYQKGYRKPLTEETTTPLDLLQVDQPSLRDLQGLSQCFTDDINQHTTSRRYRKLMAAVKRGDFLDVWDQQTIDSGQRRILSSLGELDTVSAFQNECKHHLGRVVAGSGFTKAKPCPGTHVDGESTLDWALLKIDPQRMGRNVIPGDFLSECHILPDGGFDLHLQPGNWNGDLSKTVYKLGRTTGATKGHIMPLQTVKISRQIKEDGTYETIRTYEYAVFGENYRGPFAGEGDSGALIFNLLGKVVGMLTASMPGTAISFFTPLEDLMDDIREVTGAAEVRLASPWGDEWWVDHDWQDWFCSWY